MHTQRPSQFKLWTLFVITTVITFLTGGFLILKRASDSFFHDILVGKTGQIESRDEWPEPLKKLIGNYTHDIDVGSIKVYCLCQGFDPEYVIRINVSPDLRDFVLKKWQLSRVQRPYLGSVFAGRSQISGSPTPKWWNPATIADIKYYVCPNTLSGAKGDRFQVAYTEENGDLYVHYWFNF